jgi:hypothetical protein
VPLDAVELSCTDVQDLDGLLDRDRLPFAVVAALTHPIPSHHVPSTETSALVRTQTILREQ